MQSLVAKDADSIAAQDYRLTELEPLFTETDESYMTSTVPMDLTESDMALLRMTSTVPMDSFG